MTHIKFKKIQIPAFFVALVYLSVCVWFFLGPNIKIGIFSPRGFNLGIDFKGGFVHQLTIYSGIPQDEIRKYSEESGLGDEIQGILIPEDKKLGNETTYLIRATISKEEQEMIDKDPTLTSTKIYSNKIHDLYSKIEEKHGGKYVFTGNELKKANQLFPNSLMTGEIAIEKNQNQRVVENVVKDSENVISASYSKSLRLQVVLLILFVLFILMLYITFRFKLEFGVGAVLCLFHDVIVMLGYISLFNVEVDYTIIAAILFIMGYSLNDTIVIFDRIRENIEKLKEYPLKDIVSISINQTLIRSIITSFTTFMAAMALVIWGGPKIAGFSRTIAIGIFFGTYSSIFIAAPIVLLWNMIFKSKKTKELKEMIVEENQIPNKQENLTLNIERQETINAQSNFSNVNNSKLQLSKKQLKKLYGGKK